MDPTLVWIVAPSDTGTFVNQYSPLPWEVVLRTTAPFTRSSTRFPPGVAVFSTVPRALASFGPVRLDRIVRVSASGPTMDPTDGMDEATRKRARATTTIPMVRRADLGPRSGSRTLTWRASRLRS